MQVPTSIGHAPDPAPPLSVKSFTPRAEVLLGAGPRKTPTRDSELGEDVAGVVVTPDRIICWVLDGTSDEDIIRNDQQQRDVFSSRLFCLAISAALYQQASCHQGSTQELVTVAIAEATRQLQASLPQQIPAIDVFVAGEPAGKSHWQASATLVMAILSADGQADLYRVGDSKVLCYDANSQLLLTSLDQKPSTSELGRLYLRLERGETYSLKAFLPERPEQHHQAQATDIRQLILISDGVGPITEQYLRRMLGEQQFAAFHDTLVRTPHRTYDDKSLVLASFEQPAA